MDIVQAISGLSPRVKSRTFLRSYITGTTTAGSSVITGLSSTATLAIGNLVSGAGIPASTYIRSISGSTLTMENSSGVLVNALATVTTNYLTCGASSLFKVPASSILITMVGGGSCGAGGFTTDGVAQVETATVAGTVTTSGLVTVTVTSAAVGAIAPYSIPVYVGDTASTVASRIRDVLKRDTTNIYPVNFLVSVSTTAVVLTSSSCIANDATLNIAIAGNSTGITDAASSANTTSGVNATIFGGGGGGGGASAGINRKVCSTIKGSTLTVNVGSGADATPPNTSATNVPTLSSVVGTINVAVLQRMEVFKANGNTSSSLLATRGTATDGGVGGYSGGQQSSYKAGGPAGVGVAAAGVGLDANRSATKSTGGSGGGGNSSTAGSNVAGAGGSDDASGGNNTAGNGAGGAGAGSLVGQGASGSLPGNIGASPATGDFGAGGAGGASAYAGGAGSDGMVHIEWFD